MKLKTFFVMAMLAVVFASCTMRSTFYGGVVVTPTEARNGDEITMKIGPFDLGPEVGVSVSTETSINGKNTVKSVNYYIDGKCVASSSDADDEYAATYTLSDIEVGVHEITALVHPIRIGLKLMNILLLRKLLFLDRPI